MIYPMPLNMADTLVTSVVGSAKQRKGPSYFQERKQGDSLGFCKTKSILRTRTPWRELGLFSLLSVQSSSKLLELQQGRWSFTIPLWSQRWVESHILSARLAQMLLSCASLCLSYTSHNWSSELCLIPGPYTPHICHLLWVRSLKLGQ